MTVPLFILYSLGETKAEEDNIRTNQKIDWRDDEFG